jgi:hypothetical protein
MEHTKGQYVQFPGVFSVPPSPNPTKETQQAPKYKPNTWAREARISLVVHEDSPTSFFNTKSSPDCQIPIYWKHNKVAIFCFHE